MEMTDAEITKLLGHWLQGKLPDTRNINDESANLLIKQADWHGISPLLYHRLNEAGHFHEIHEIIKNHLSQSHHQAIAATMFTNQELKTVYRLFANNGIEYLLFKGTPLSHTLYPEPYLRVRCDTDILFADKATTRKAYKLLLQCGYALPTAIEGELISQELCCYKRSKSGFVHALDLHWNVNNLLHFAGLFSYSELQSHSEHLSIEGEPASPEPVYALLLACIHRVAHIPYGEADRLIWLYDIHLLSNSFDDAAWEQLLQLTLEKKLAAVVLDGLEKSRRFLDTRLPEEVITALEAHREVSIVKPRYQLPQWSYQLNNLKSLPGWQSRLLFIRENLLPAPEYMYAKYRLKQPLLLPLLYIIRLFQGIPKLFRVNG